MCQIVLTMLKGDELNKFNRKSDYDPEWTCVAINYDFLFDLIKEVA